MTNEYDTGYIKLYRSLLSWEWHDSQSVVTVFLHCLLLANWEPKKWRGIEIARGSFITSTVKLSEVTGLCRQTVTDCLRRLEATGELTVTSTHRYTLITVNNYDRYQDEKPAPVNSVVKSVVNPVVNSVVKNLDNCLDNCLDTTEEVKKVKNKEEIYIVVSYLNDRASASFRPTSEKTKTLIRARLREGYTVEDFKKVIDNKVAEWSGTDMQKYLRPETLFGTKFESYLNQKTNSLPVWYTSEPVRQAEQRPATAEEVEQVRQLLMKGSTHDTS